MILIYNGILSNGMLLLTCTLAYLPKEEHTEIMVVELYSFVGLRILAKENKDQYFSTF